MMLDLFRHGQIARTCQNNEPKTKYIVIIEVIILMGMMAGPNYHSHSQLRA